LGQVGASSSKSELSEFRKLIALARVRPPGFIVRSITLMLYVYEGVQGNMRGIRR
jgi:hypothetical protein